MAEPISMSLAAAGTALSTYQAYENNRAQAKAEEYNAQEARLAAEQTGRAYGLREDAMRRQQRAILGEQAAAIGESGVANLGSARDIAMQSAMNAELDALNIRYEGEMKKRGLMYESSQAKYRSKQAKKAATMSLIGGGLQMAGGIAGGIGEMNYRSDIRKLANGRSSSSSSGGYNLTAPSSIRTSLSTRGGW